jgi:hypothetical protein
MLRLRVVCSFEEEAGALFMKDEEGGGWRVDDG